MRKTLITMIIVLLTLILAIVGFVEGYKMTNGNNDSDSSKKNAETNINKESGTSAIPDDGGGQSAAPLTPDYDPTEDTEAGNNPEEEPEEKPEEKPKEEPQEEPKEEPEEKPEEKPEENPQSGYPDYPEGSDKWYRVRTSAGSDGKQDGAFRSFANAKAHADTLKAQGYKVYDHNMNCIYTP